MVSQNFSRLSLSKLSFIQVCGCKVNDTTNVHALWFSLKGYVGTSNHLHIPSVHINRVWTVCACSACVVGVPLPEGDVRCCQGCLFYILHQRVSNCHRLWWPPDCTIGLLIHWPTECQVGDWKAKHEELHYFLHTQGGMFSKSTHPPTVCIRPLILLGLLGRSWKVRPEARIVLQALCVDKICKISNISKTGGNSAHVKENCPPGETGLWLVLGMLVGWGVHKGHNRALRDFGFVHLWQFAQIWPMILACYSGHPRWRPALFICRIMALIFHSRVCGGVLSQPLVCHWLLFLNEQFMQYQLLYSIFHKISI